MIIAWDFDGVLNRNQAGGRYVWEDEFTERVGQPASAFGAFVFGRPPMVISGEIDILDRLEEWTASVDCLLTAREILDYWLAADARPDGEMIQLIDALNRAGVRQVIATNNEARRAAYIADRMAMGARMERVFASGHLGVAKPDPRYFRQITEALGSTPEEMFFVDDLQANVQAAVSCGWQGYHFTEATRADLIARLMPGSLRAGR